jgi:glycosyltransferase involved in cell wall biosynthesis
MTPRVSVVLPTYHRDVLLRRCLDRLVSQRLEPSAYEIVVVDDARSTTAPQVVAHLAAGAEVRIVCLPGAGRGPATARNIGWRTARAPVIAFIDDDAYPEDDLWLPNGLRRMDESAASAISGRVRVPVDDPPTDFQRNVRRLEQAAFLTCNAFVRRDVLERIGGFDERFGAAFREDSDLQFRIEAAGGVIERADEVRVVHPAPRGPWGVSLKLQRYSQYNALIYKKHPGRYAELNAGPPLAYYGMLGLLLAGMAAFVLGWTVVAAAALAVLAGLLAAFFVRRTSGTSKRPRDVLEMAITSLVIPPLSVYWRLRGAWRYRVLFA